MPQFTIDLPDALQAYVMQKVAAGQFNSPDAFVTEVLIRHRWREHVEAKVLAAHEADDYSAVTPDFWQSLRELATRVGAEHGQ